MTEEISWDKRLDMLCDTTPGDGLVFQSQSMAHNWTVCSLGEALHLKYEINTLITRSPLIAMGVRFSTAMRDKEFALARKIHRHIREHIRDHPDEARKLAEFINDMTPGDAAWQARLKELNGMEDTSCQ